MKSRLKLSYSSAALPLENGCVQGRQKCDLGLARDASLKEVQQITSAKERRILVNHNTTV